MRSDLGVRDCHVALDFLDAPSAFAKAIADKRNDKLALKAFSPTH
jgi:hypothetical protein